MIELTETRELHIQVFLFDSFKYSCFKFSCQIILIGEQFYSKNIYNLKILVI